MQPETAREVEIARAAYVRGRQDERTAWREGFKTSKYDQYFAADLYPMPAEVKP